MVQQRLLRQMVMVPDSDGEFRQAINQTSCLHIL